MNPEEMAERNVGELVRRSVLPLDAARTARARERFLNGSGARAERLSWKLAAAAAALLVCCTIFWSANRGPATPETPAALPGKTPVETPAAFLGNGGDANLRGILKVPREGNPAARLRFDAQSPLPEGLVFSIRVQRLERHVKDKTLEWGVLDSFPTSATLQNGVFDLDWAYKGPGKVRLEVSALDGLQDRTVVKQLRIPEAERRWTFEYSAWSGRLLSMIGPQLVEIGDLAREGRDLVTRVEAACASEALFQQGKKALVAEAERLQSRAANFAANGLFPASCHELEFTASDLAHSMAIFKWDGGKFAGPSSYHTNDKKGTTHRNQTFEFDALRSYLDEAVFTAGREFGLWILEEFGRAGPRSELADAVKPHETKPGLADVAERLKRLVNEFHGVDLGPLDQEMRRIGK